MRKITSHIVNPVNDKIVIRVLDEPGAGGANHEYDVIYNNIDDPKRDGDPGQPRTLCTIHFQNGPINENGINGITQEVLLAICIDRLESFQAGPYACRANAIALTKMQEAQMWLQQRTLERMRRGVEGTSIK